VIEEKNVKVPFRKLKYIHHMSDIQIRNLKRHKEYEEVFERTYEEVRKYPDNAVAYIGGDIAHSKTEMSPELVDQLSRLFKNLADIVPTIIIAGNHDCNLNNRSRLDCLSPIVDNLKHPNLHYLKDTGVYKCADVKFVVWDVWDDKKKYIKAKDVKGDTKIVLFHGTVDKCQTDLGFRLPSDVKITQFKGYDMGLLGDIHKRQHLNKEETISYCGSLVQQNHGEGLDHGYLLWDVPKRKSTYIPVHNEFGYYTLDIDNGKFKDVIDMPQKARLRLRVANTNAVQLKKILALIHSKYGIKEINVIRTDGFSGDKIRVEDKIDVGDITNSDYQYNLIEDYLNRNYIVDEELLVKIKEINDDLNVVLPDEEIQRNVSWKLKSLEFDNMFSYGKDNVVNFTKLNGIVGLFAPNASGKSSLLDALSFCLFDTSSRAFKAANILNNKKGSFHCKANFEIDGLDYYIERTAKKNFRSGHVKVDVEFWMVDEGGDKISLNGDQRRTTNANIRRVVGTFEDFVLTSLSLQTNNTVFIDKTQKERKELLAQFMGIGIFDQLYMLAHEDISEVSAILKDFKKRDYGLELSDINKNLLILNKVESKLLVEKGNISGEESQLNVDILELTKKLKSVDDSILDVDKLKGDKLHTRGELNDIDVRLGTLKSNRTQNEFRETELKEKIKNYTDSNLNQKYLKLQQFIEDRKDTKIEIDKLKIEVRHKLDKIDKLGNLKYDEDCEFCMSNPFTLDAISTREGLDDDKKLADKYVKKYDRIDKKVRDLEYAKNDKVDLDRSLNALQNIEIQNSKFVSEETVLRERKKALISQITIFEEKISKYYMQEKDILYNKEIEEDIEDLKITINDLSALIQKNEDDLNDSRGKIKVAETNKQNIVDTINKVEDLEIKYKAYEYYLDAVKRDGVPYELVSKALPTVEGEVNNILAQIVDFNIVLQMDGKNINTFIAYDEDNVWPLELSSGMERFISSLAIRVGLINVCNLPRTNFLAIDEGWGTMDSDNLNSVYNLFQYLKSQFQFTLIVSHIESMRDAVDSLLEIKKEGNYSNINYA